MIDGRSVRSCLMLAVQADGVEYRNHRRTDGAERHRRSAARIRGPQRPAMRILHARYARHRGRAAGSVQAVEGGDSRRSVRKLLPLHRLSGHRRCDRSGCPTAPGSRHMTDSRSIIGRRMPRPEAVRLAAGRGRYTDDIDVAKLGAHRIPAQPLSARPHRRDRYRGRPSSAGRDRGGDRRRSRSDLQAVADAASALYQATVSPPQYPLARDEACWQGEAVVAVVADTRAQAEDALELDRDRHGTNCRRSPRPEAAAVGAARPSPTARCRAILVSSTPFVRRRSRSALSAMPPSWWSMISLSDGRPASRWSRGHRGRIRSAPAATHRPSFASGAATRCARSSPLSSGCRCRTCAS